MPISISCRERLNETTHVKCLEWLLTHSKNSFRVTIIIIILIFHHDDSQEKRHHWLLGQVYLTLLHSVGSIMQRLFHPQNTQNVLLVQPTSLFLPKECLSILILRGVYLWTSQESNKITQSGYYALGVYNTVYYFQNTCVRSWLK